MTACGKSIANLDRVDLRASLLIDDRGRVLFARQQERADAWRDSRGNLGIAETSPIADAPASIAIHASSMLPMQQIFTRGRAVGFMMRIISHR
jgi:hypothetical protein